MKRLASLFVLSLSLLFCSCIHAQTCQHSVTATWVPSPSAGVTSYNVYRSTTSGSGYTKIGSSPVSLQPSYSDTTVVCGNTYYYVVTAVSSSGTTPLESGYSNEAKAVIPTTILLPPTMLAVLVK